MSVSKDWEQEFSSKFFDLTNSFPIMRAGTTPLKDIQVSKLAGSKQWWFTYPLGRYKAMDWYDVLDTIRYDTEVQVDISSALELSQNIGIPVNQRNIPNLWVMCVDIHGINSILK